MDEDQIEAVAIQLGLISDLLADTEKLIAQNRAYIRELLQGIADDQCPFTAAELHGEIRDLHEDRETVIDGALQQVEELVDAVRAVLLAPTHASASHGVIS